MRFSVSFLSFILFLDKSIERYANCSCSNFIDEKGYGNCQKLVPQKRGHPLCYVNEPSSCTDLRPHKQTGRIFSWKACTSTFSKYYRNILFRQTMWSFIQNIMISPLSMCTHILNFSGRPLLLWIPSWCDGK